MTATKSLSSNTSHITFSKLYWKWFDVERSNTFFHVLQANIPYYSAMQSWLIFAFHGSLSIAENSFHVKFSARNNNVITITIHGQEYNCSIYRAAAMSTVFMIYKKQNASRMYDVATTISSCSCWIQLWRHTEDTRDGSFTQSKFRNII